MGDTKIREGFIAFDPPEAGKRCSIWYTIHGDLHSGKRPLLVLHGGPGLTHDYMLSLTDLAAPPYNRPVILYDQLGCGRSTPLPEKLRDYSFWSLKLYLDELTTVLTTLGIQDDYDLLGHSWGGMLASTHAARQPLGLKRLVLTGTAVSTSAWMRAYHLYRDRMPDHHREVLERPRDFDTEDTPEYEEALEAFYARHVMTLDPFPPEYARSFEFLKRDATVTMSTLGPSEFEPISFLKSWNVGTELDKIAVPTLLINGVDEGADDESMRVFQAGLQDMRWIKFSKSAHMPHWEQRDEHMKAVASFLGG